MWQCVLLMYFYVQKENLFYPVHVARFFFLLATRCFYEKLGLSEGVRCRFIHENFSQTGKIHRDDIISSPPFFSNTKHIFNCSVNVLLIVNTYIAIAS